jgi:glycosyltransferase involved in cell wall biosynthesis
MGVPPDRVYYVPNCPGAAFLERRQQVDPSQAASLRQELGIYDAPMAIYVGHITLGDDLDIALAAWKRVREQLPAARLVIVGSGDGLERLKSKVRAMDLAQSVTFTGWVDHSLVPTYLAAANVAVYPYRDTLINRAKCSIKVLEYMTMGKAVVTHRVGQNIEYLEHLHSGYLAEPGSVEDFCRGLLQVLQDQDLARRLGNRAAQRIERKFNWEIRIEDVERAYKGACDAG